MTRTPGATSTVPPITDPAPTASATDQPSAGDGAFNGEMLIATADVVSGRLEVTAMLPAVSESGGTCTLTVPGRSLAVSVAASPGNGVTYCGLMSVPANAPDAVDWEFLVSYESAAVSAQSPVTTVGALR